MMSSRLLALMAAAVSVAVVTLAAVLLYALWWNAHFACVQYRP